MSHNINSNNNLTNQYKYVLIIADNLDPKEDINFYLNEFFMHAGLQLSETTTLLDSLVYKSKIQQNKKRSYYICIQSYSIVSALQSGKLDICQNQKINSFLRVFYNPSLGPNAIKTDHKYCTDERYSVFNIMITNNPLGVAKIHQIKLSSKPVAKNKLLCYTLIQAKFPDTALSILEERLNNQFGHNKSVWNLSKATSATDKYIKELNHEDIKLLLLSSNITLISVGLSSNYNKELPIDKSLINEVGTFEDSNFKVSSFETKSEALVHWLKIIKSSKLISQALHFTNFPVVNKDTLCKLKNKTYMHPGVSSIDIHTSNRKITIYIKHMDNQTKNLSTSVEEHFKSICSTLHINLNKTIKHSSRCGRFKKLLQHIKRKLMNKKPNQKHKTSSKALFEKIATLEKSDESKTISRQISKERDDKLRLKDNQRSELKQMTREDIQSLKREKRDRRIQKQNDMENEALSRARKNKLDSLENRTKIFLESSMIKLFKPSNGTFPTPSTFRTLIKKEIISSFQPDRLLPEITPEVFATKCVQRYDQIQPLLWSHLSRLIQAETSCNFEKIECNNDVKDICSIFLQRLKAAKFKTNSLNEYIQEMPPIQTPSLITSSSSNSTSKLNKGLYRKDLVYTNMMMSTYNIINSSHSLEIKLVLLMILFNKETNIYDKAIIASNICTNIDYHAITTDIKNLYHIDYNDDDEDNVAEQPIYVDALTSSPHLVFFIKFLFLLLLPLSTIFEYIRIISHTYNPIYKDNLIVQQRTVENPFDNCLYEDEDDYQDNTTQKYVLSSIPNNIININTHIKSYEKEFLHSISKTTHKDHLTVLYYAFIEYNKTFPTSTSCSSSSSSHSSSPSSLSSSYLSSLSSSSSVSTSQSSSSTIVTSSTSKSSSPSCSLSSSSPLSSSVIYNGQHQILRRSTRNRTKPIWYGFEENIKCGKNTKERGANEQVSVSEPTQPNRLNDV